MVIAIAKADVGTLVFFYLFAIIMLPFSIWITLYIIVRCKYNLKSLYVDDVTSEVEITYYKFKEIHKINAAKSVFHVNFRKDNYTIGEYYVLEFYIDNKLIFTQYQEGWSVEDFFNITKTLIDNSIKCNYSFALKKRFFEDE